MSHSHHEAHLSSLSRAIMRMSKDQISRIKEERAGNLGHVMRSTANHDEEIRVLKHG